MRRGDVYYADLRPVIGSEQGGIRPVLIIQNDVVKFIYDNLHKPIKEIREYLISNEDKTKPINEKKEEQIDTSVNKKEKVIEVKEKKKKETCKNTI